LTVVKGTVFGPFCLVLRNNNDVPIWPFIFICEPSGFTILPWYMPHPAITEAPLLPGKSHTVGCRNQDGLLYQWKKNRKTDISYIKIFMTTERTRFSSMLQQRNSLFEDQVRELDERNPSTEHSEVTGSDSSGNSLPSSNLQHDYEDPRPDNLGSGPKWAAMRITIKRKYEQEPDNDHDSSNNGSDFDY